MVRAFSVTSSPTSPSPRVMAYSEKSPDARHNVPRAKARRASAPLHSDEFLAAQQFADAAVEGSLQFVYIGRVVGAKASRSNEEL